MQKVLSDKICMHMHVHPQHVSKDLNRPPPPVHHVDSLEVDESFADLQAEQHQRYVRQLVLVLR